MSNIWQVLTKIKHYYWGKYSIDLYGEEGETLRKITSPDMMKGCEVIDECPDDTYPVVMEDFVNYEHEDSIKKYLIEENDTKVNYEVREISIYTENEYLINKDTIFNETGKNMNIYKELIYECLDDTSTAMV